MKKVIIADVHVTDEEDLKCLEFFLNNAIGSEAALYFIGNGFEFLYDEYADSAMRLISDTVSRLSGSRMVKGNHESLDYAELLVDRNRMFEFTSLPIYDSCDGIVIAHNVENIRDVDKDDVDESYNLFRILLEEAKASCSDPSLLKSLELPATKDELGMLARALEKIDGRDVKIQINGDYFKSLYESLQSLGANVAFVGHEHNLDLDTTMAFQLERHRSKWGVLTAGTYYMMRDGKKYVFVTPHFSGKTHRRISMAERACHYLEYEPSTSVVSYKKLQL